MLFPYDDAAGEITRRLTRLRPQDGADQRAAAELGRAASGGLPRCRGCRTGSATISNARSRFAEALGAQHLHLMAGQAQGVVARKTYLDNLRWAAAQAPRASLTIEPINPADMPGYFLNDFDQAAEILDEVGAPNLSLQFDMYHAQMITGDGMAVWEKHGRAGETYPGRRRAGAARAAEGRDRLPGLLRPARCRGLQGLGLGRIQPDAQTEAGLLWMTPDGS